MRWYFGIDEGGTRGEIGPLAKLAVLSARAVGGLEPVLLYHGARNDYTAWMERHGVRIVETRPSFWNVVEQAQAAGSYKPLTIGHWLRVMIPQVETEHEHVLYTDCDVIFLRRFAWETLTPRVFAAAPEFSPDNWDYFNSGVMLLNVPALRATWEELRTLIVTRVQDPAHYRYDDQIALNEGYKGFWERLPTLCNHKPYWPFAPDVSVLHFHGPKPPVLEALARGTGPGASPAERYFAKMLEARADAYLAWARYLGDHLQGIDLDSALRFARLASALTSYRKTLPAQDRPWPPAGEC